MNKYFTTYEQSQRLLKFGVLADTADAYYVFGKDKTVSDEDLFILDGETYSEAVRKIDENVRKEIISPKNVVPAWSLWRLIRIIKECGIDDWHKQDIMNNILKEDSRMMVPVAVIGITQLIDKNLIDFQNLRWGIDMKKFKRMLKFFLLWLLFLVMLPFGMFAVGMILLGLIIIMVFPKEKRNKAEAWLMDMLNIIISLTGHYEDLMESCLIKD